MANVLPTTLTTDPPGHEGELSLCDGFAMFPWLGTARAAPKLNGTSGTIFSTSLNFEILKIDLSSNYEFFMGLCGPAYAVEIETTEETEYEVPEPGQPSSGKLVIGDHALRGGFQVGMDFDLGIEFGLTLNLIFFKKKLIDTDANINIDIINLIYQLLITLLEQGAEGGGDTDATGDPNEFEMSTFSSDGEGGVDNEEDGGAGTEGQSSGEEGGGGVKSVFRGMGMVNKIENPWLTPNGTTVEGPPSATLQPNISMGFSIVPLFAEIPILDILFAIDEGLERVGGGFEFGPGVAIGLPTKVTLKGATISQHPFDVVDTTTASNIANPDTTMTLEERTPIASDLAPLGPRASEIGALLEHEVGFSAGIYFFAEFTFFKVFHIGAQTGTVNLIDVEPLPGGAGGPFESNLSFVPGGGDAPFEPPTSAPTVSRYTQNQPQGRWNSGVLARYGVTFASDDYETVIGPLTQYDPKARFFALAELTNVPTGPSGVTRRNVYRQFNDGSPVELVGTIADNTTTTFTDTKT